MKFLIDENLEQNFLNWGNIVSIHVLEVSDIMSDTDIWNYALQNNLIIITKDTDFYNRYLSTLKSPKVIWLRIGNMRKHELKFFVQSVWEDVLNLLSNSSFIIINQNSLEAI
ncbi:MAG: DUF5615 family PIN-like protein [Bacteroidetes bacterium]|nr:DUF5615 family PIN-like protein [Bacteroidota bacterium]MBS1591863.1 DUF5615 family PIN-like protein [Bacteroidota bacterium]